ncbi:uncharacterized protein LOC121991243 [Zingiber officinale]|uniref:Uncharacterized protein n=1 Tax=Zingiber officinale TaxID=94328 RepID=A0A8J5FWZ2_ZINOF|nr:uncharacterized protein LOC121991243 [Zingiber officinale]KAG6496668.1 hypothetical protein ZIOFF_044538 [Zingiber officinale]
MGAYISSASGTASVSDESKHQHLQTAKVIAPDGRLLEYHAETTVRAVLADAGHHLLNIFLCSSDELYFNAKILALAAEDTLRLGQIYFLLPFSKLHHPLSGPDMAELAVRASVALSAYASDDSERRRKSGQRLMPAAAELAGEQAAVLNEVVNEKEIGFYSEICSSDQDYATNSSFEKKKMKMKMMMKRSESVRINSRQRRRSRRQRLSMIEEIV